MRALDTRHHVLIALVVLGLMSLACATDPSTTENRAVCDRPAEVWKMMQASTKKSLTYACDIEFGSCRKSSAEACQILWKFSSEHTKLQAWSKERKDAEAIDLLSAYETLFLKPLFETHIDHWRLYGEQEPTGEEEKAVLNKAARDAWRRKLKEARALLTLESRAPTEAFILKIRESIRKVPNPEKRELLIETYGRLRTLDTLIFEPREEFKEWEKTVRTRFEQFESAKVKLEFLPDEVTTPAASELPVAKDPEQPPPPPPPPGEELEVPPPPPPEEAPDETSGDSSKKKKKKEDTIKVIKAPPKPKDLGTETPTE